MRVGKAMMFVVVCSIVSSCVTAPEPEIRPDTPVIVPASAVLDTVDHGIYADVDPTLNAINIEWLPDSTNNTSGYHIFRSNDSLVGANGLLLNGKSVGEIESSNLLLDPLPTSFRDTTDIHVGGTYWYQLQAFHRSPTNAVTNSIPTHVDNSTSYHYETRVNLLNPAGTVTPPVSGLVFSWQDPENGGSFHVIVERIDQEGFVWSSLVHDFQSILSTEYPSNGTDVFSGIPLVAGAEYRWRVKRVDLYGGSSSAWRVFDVAP